MRAPVRAADHQLHLAVFGGEFQGVVDQVPDHLLDARGVYVNDQRARHRRGLKADLATMTVGKHHAMNVLEGANQVDRLLFQLQLARANPGDIQQVVNDPRLAGHRFADGIDRLDGRARDLGGWQAPQQFGVQLDQVQRMLEFVGHHREELILEMAVGLGFLQALILFVLGAFVAGKVAGNLDVAAQAVALELRHLATAIETAAILAHMPAFIFATPMFAGGAQFALRHASGAVFRGENQVVVSAQHLVLGVAEDQFGTGVPVGDGAMVIEDDDGKVMGALGDQAHALLAQAQFLFGLTPLGDINEGQHGAVNVIFAGAVRQQPRNVPAVVVAADFPLDHAQGLKHGGGVFGHLRVIEAVGDVQQ